MRVFHGIVVGKDLHDQLGQPLHSSPAGFVLGDDASKGLVSLNLSKNC